MKHTRNTSVISEIKAEAQQIKKLSEITAGTILHGLASAMITKYGYYACMLAGVKTFIEK